MKNIFAIFFLASILFGCKKEQLNKNLEKEILNYQKKIPFPKNYKFGEKYKFIYLVNFSIFEKDTLMTIERSTIGIYDITNYNGVYLINDKTPVAILDTLNLGGKFIPQRIKNSLLTKYKVSDESNFDEYPPKFNYLIKGDNLKLIGIDTIMRYWIGNEPK